MINKVPNVILRFPSNKLFCGIVLLLLFSLFTFSYILYVIPPQTGWWQYYAWRMTEGDILYKDIYLFMPPYFVFLTKILYSFFGNHLLFYTLFAGFPIKVICILILYNILSDFVKPAYASISVLFGACLAATYQMDMLYDYNPVTILPCLLLAQSFCLYYKKLIKGEDCTLISFIIGVLLSIIYCFKHTFGLAFGFTTIVMQIVIYWREYNGRKYSFIKYCISVVAGIVIGALPFIIYLSCNHSWADYFQCLSGGSAAKGGILAILTRPFIILSEFKIWVYLLILFLISFIPFHKKLKYASVLSNLIILTCWITILIGFYIMWNKGPQYTESLPFDNMLVKWKFRICKMAIYGGLLFWLFSSVKYFTNRETNTVLLIFSSFICVHFFSSTISANDLEELFFLLYIPVGVALLLNTEFFCNTLKNMAIVSTIAFYSIYCFGVKQGLPYSWQGWRTLPIKSEYKVSDIEGLEGYRFSARDNYVYSRIVSLIEENCTSDDSVFQFANIPLFNVLTQKRIPLFTPITWLDVCNDDYARMATQTLKANPPKMIIWHNMDKKEWIFVESVFRNGKQSGQREILSYYNQFIQKKYIKLLSVSNNRDGTIEVWKKPDNY